MALKVMIHAITKEILGQLQVAQGQGAITEVSPGYASLGGSNRVVEVARRAAEMAI